MSDEKPSHIRKLSFERLRLDGGTQMRAGDLNEDHVKELVEKIERGEQLDPVDVMQDGTNYWLWDGFHRVEAYQRITPKRSTISARITQGDHDDAIVAAAGANKMASLTRTKEDKRRAIEACLKNPKCATWSDRRIAAHVGVHNTTVGGYRNQVQSPVDNLHVTGRVGADGKTYKKRGQREAGDRKTYDNALAKIEVAPDRRAAEEAYASVVRLADQGRLSVEQCDAAGNALRAKFEALDAPPAAESASAAPLEPEVLARSSSEPVAIEPEPVDALGPSIEDEERGVRLIQRACATLEDRLAKLGCKVRDLRHDAVRAECELELLRVARRIAEQLPDRVSVHSAPAADAAE